VQWSPRARLRGTAWDTAASQTIDFFTEVAPASAATPTGAWQLGYSRNGAAATYPAIITSAGNMTLLGSVTMPAASSLSWSGVGFLTGGGATGLFMLRNVTATTGVGFDVATDAVFKVRTRALSAYATVDALGYSVGGVAGASKAAGAVTSITVVNGIVTAIS
jgi:hypothetical protein